MVCAVAATCYSAIVPVQHDLSQSAHLGRTVPAVAAMHEAGVAVVQAARHRGRGRQQQLDVRKPSGTMCDLLMKL